ncbi:hypothetical protein ACFU5Y_29865 [Streptomyces gardneri]|uniref:hypothetical protein n=1 Tax=Streptomyces gardneri TaxID=66892 RepID=UPI003691CEEA
MTESDEEGIADLEAAPRPDDPRFAPGRGRFPDSWAVLAAVAALAAMVTGALLPNGLVLAAGLITAGLAVHLFDGTRRRRGRPKP